MTHHITLALLVIATLSVASASTHVTAKLESCKMIWDAAPHNAFTSLLFHKGKFYCAFREGRLHASTDGTIRVLASPDADKWESVAHIEWDGYDLRDACLSETPDGRLMLSGGIAPRKHDNEPTPTGTFACFSKDGKTWTAPKIVTELGMWLWRVTWHKGKAYGFAYGDKRFDLMSSEDGLTWSTLAKDELSGGQPSEAQLRFDRKDHACALVRRDNSTAMLGESSGDLTKWEWTDLAHLRPHVEQFNDFGGPDFIETLPGLWIGAARVYEKDVNTGLTVITTDPPTMRMLLILPSGGDCSYPGLAWHNGVLYVSYYSSHEGKARIYLAKVRIQQRTE